MDKQTDITDTIHLYKSHNVYNHLSKDDIAQHILPSVALSQYKVFRYDKGASRHERRELELAWYSQNSCVKTIT